MNWDTRNWIFGYLKSAEKWVQDQMNKSRFYSKLLACLMIFQSFTVPLAHSSYLKRHQIINSIPKFVKVNEEKPCSTCLKPISPWYFKNPKSGPSLLIPQISLFIDIWSTVSKPSLPLLPDLILFYFFLL